MLWMYDVLATYSCLAAGLQKMEISAALWEGLCIFVFKLYLITFVELICSYVYFLPCACCTAMNVLFSVGC